MSDEENQNLPRVLSYCSVFLNQEMLHVYRQITALKRYEAHVLTWRPKNLDQFPYPRLLKLNKNPNALFRGLRRFYWKTLKHQQVPLSKYQIEQIHKKTDQINPALIHIYFGTEAVRLISYLEYEKRPKIVSFHGVDTSNALKQRDLEKLLKYTDLFLVRSKSLKIALIDRGCPPERIRLNPTGVPIPAVVPKRTVPSLKKGEPLRLLQACRFIGKKGLDVTINAIAILQEQGVFVQLDLAGSGPQEVALRDQVKRLNLEKNIRFLGFVKNDTLLASLHRYHLFLHPSQTTSENDREGIPNAILEAMAYGIPVVSTKHSGIPEVITSGKNGILLNQLNATELSNAIIHVISDPMVYSHISKNARQTIINRFSIENNTTELEKSYEFVISLHKRNNPT